MVVGNNWSDISALYQVQALCIRHAILHKKMERIFSETGTTGFMEWCEKGAEICSVRSTTWFFMGPLPERDEEEWGLLIPECVRTCMASVKRTGNFLCHSLKLTFFFSILKSFRCRTYKIRNFTFLYCLELFYFINF